MPDSDLEDGERRGLSGDHEPVVPEFIQLATTPRRQIRHLWPILATGAGMLAFYLIYFPEEGAKPRPEPSPPGWETLLDCAFTTSLDGKKERNLFEDQSAVFYDKTTKDGGGKYRTIDGTWSFDQAVKRFVVTLDGIDTTYSVVLPEGAGICMLIKGDVGAADLTASWFSSGSDDDPGDYDYRPDPRD
jgi:hypothetical protein